MVQSGMKCCGFDGIARWYWMWTRLMVQKCCKPVEAWRISHVPLGFRYNQWCRISSINSMSTIVHYWMIEDQLTFFQDVWLNWGVYRDFPQEGVKIQPLGNVETIALYFGALHSEPIFVWKVLFLRWVNGDTRIIPNLPVPPGFFLPPRVDVSIDESHPRPEYFANHWVRKFLHHLTWQPCSVPGTKS